MKWENLQKNKCPYCEEFLEFDGDNEITCTSCRFHISPIRFKVISEKRSHAKDAVRIKIRWQNLRVGRCPQCGEDLRDAIGKLEISECVKAPTCTFKIRNDKMMDILNDPLHPVHQYEI